ncbi:hypothetical protein L2E82_49667 [Cichorium intybus]|uniref:Uncharacterized protein n=1 Tax=Cichorium intybus TaxID=13427 RepID=A0ACB8Z1J5_CICIN|nr:hypothetical protein L2E82_49667 [Cichorium intybus]
MKPYLSLFPNFLSYFLYKNPTLRTKPPLPINNTICRLPPSDPTPISRLTTMEKPDLRLPIHHRTEKTPSTERT